MFQLFCNRFPSIISSGNDPLFAASLILYEPSQLVPSLRYLESLVARVLALST